MEIIDLGRQLGICLVVSIKYPWDGILQTYWARPARWLPPSFGALLGSHLEEKNHARFAGSPTDFDYEAQLVRTDDIEPAKCQNYE